MVEYQSIYDGVSARFLAESAIKPVYQVLHQHTSTLNIIKKNVKTFKRKIYQVPEITNSVDIYTAYRDLGGEPSHCPRCRAESSPPRVGRGRARTAAPAGSDCVSPAGCRSGSPASRYTPDRAHPSDRPAPEDPAHTSTAGWVRTSYSVHKPLKYKCMLLIINA